MRLSKAQMVEAFELRQKGVNIENLGAIFNVGPQTMARYLRNAESYGFSLWDGDGVALSMQDRVDELTTQNLKLMSQLTTITTHLDALQSSLVEINSLFDKEVDGAQLSFSELVLGLHREDN